MNSMVADTLTWKSPKEDANEYSSVIVVNWMSEYSALRHISPLASTWHTGGALTCT